MSHFDDVGRDISEIITSEDCDNTELYEDMFFDLARTYRKFCPGKSLFHSILSPSPNARQRPSDLDTSLQTLRHQGEQLLSGVSRIEMQTDKIARRFKDKKRKNISWRKNVLERVVEIWLTYRFDISSITPSKGQKISKTDVFYYKERELAGIGIKSPDEFIKAINDARKLFPELFHRNEKQQSWKNLSS